jgi:hypothetical protein
MVHSSHSNLRLVPFLIAGALIGAAGVAAFGLVHAAIIVPIWARLAPGIPFAIVAGLTMGALTVVYVLSGAAIGPLASLLARRPRRRRALPVSS